MYSYNLIHGHVPDSRGQINVFIYWEGVLYLSIWIDSKPIVKESLVDTNPNDEL